MDKIFFATGVFANLFVIYGVIKFRQILPKIGNNNFYINIHKDEKIDVENRIEENEEKVDSEKNIEERLRRVSDIDESKSGWGNYLSFKGK